MRRSRQSRAGAPARATNSGWWHREGLRVSLELRGRVFLSLGILTLVVAYGMSRGELLFIGALLIGLPLIALVALRMRQRRWSIARQFSPPIAEVGQPVTVQLEVRSQSPKSGRAVLWRDSLPWPPFGTSATRLPRFSRVRGGFGVGTASTKYILNPPRRGIFDIGPFRIEVSDPFRVARSEVRVGGTQKLVVAPRVVRLPVTTISMEADDPAASAHHRLSSARGSDTMTREYRHGDELRRVHWKATARHGELMVRLEEKRSRTYARILLDTRWGGYHDAVGTGEDQPQSERFEWAVAFTASLALHLQDIGFTVEVIETAYRQLGPPDGYEEFLESLAAIRLVEAPSRRSAISMTHSTDDKRGSAFVLIADADVNMLDSLANQRAQFGTAVAFVLNPRNSSALARLQDAGWDCVAVNPTDDPVTVWLDAELLRTAKLSVADHDRP